MTADRLTPAVLAEDLRNLADGPFDAATVDLLVQAADVCEAASEIEREPRVESSRAHSAEPLSLDALTERIESALEVACKHVELYDVGEDGEHRLYQPDPDDDRLMSPLARITRCLRSAGLLNEYDDGDGNSGGEFGVVVGGAAVKAARARLGLSVRDLAELADVAPMTVQRAEKGLPIRPSSQRALDSVLAERPRLHPPNPTPDEKYTPTA